VTSRTTTLAVVAVLFFGAEARAADVAVNAGALEVVVLPGPVHGGLYPYLGLSAAFPLKGVTLIPSLSVEVAPENWHWGLVAILTADFALSEKLGLDVNVALIHDQPGFRWLESVFYVGGGAGVSFFLGKWTVSPFVNVFATFGASGASVVPGVNVAYTL
jgi:hypothetical protein